MGWRPEINQAVRNNVQKFPEGYIIEMTRMKSRGGQNFDLLGGIRIFNTFTQGLHRKGLLHVGDHPQSKRATETTRHRGNLAWFRELSRNMKSLAANRPRSGRTPWQHVSGEIMSSPFDDGLGIIETESEFELNLATWSNSAHRETRKEIKAVVFDGETNFHGAIIHSFWKMPAFFKDEADLRTQWANQRPRRPPQI